MQSLSKVGVSDGQLGAKTHQTLKMAYRLVEYSLLQKDLAEHVLGVGAARVESDRSLKTRTRRRQVSALHGGKAGLIRSCRIAVRGLLLRSYSNAADDCKNDQTGKKSRGRHRS